MTSNQYHFCIAIALKPLIEHQFFLLKEKKEERAEDGNGPKFTPVVAFS